MYRKHRFCFCFWFSPFVSLLLSPSPSAFGRVHMNHLFFQNCDKAFKFHHDSWPAERFGKSTQKTIQQSGALKQIERFFLYRSHRLCSCFLAVFPFARPPASGRTRDGREARIQVESKPVRVDGQGFRSTAQDHSPKRGPRRGTQGHERAPTKQKRARSEPTRSRHDGPKRNQHRFGEASVGFFFFFLFSLGLLFKAVFLVRKLPVFFFFFLKKKRFSCISQPFLIMHKNTTNFQTLLCLKMGCSGTDAI